MEILSVCTINFINNTIRCVPEKHCCSSKNGLPFWESWYTWFGIGLLFLFLLTSLLAYLVTVCKKKQQNLIRIRNLSGSAEELNVISTISGPGGIIQPDIRYCSGRISSEPSTVIGIPDARSWRIQHNVAHLPLMDLSFGFCFLGTLVPRPPTEMHRFNTIPFFPFHRTITQHQYYSHPVDQYYTMPGCDERVETYAKPLSPPYPPVEPVTIIKGSAPAEGYRQTASYTDIVLPPGFIDSDHYRKP